MSQERTTIKTRDGRCDASVFRPERGSGPWPAVLVFMDGRGIRPALFELAQRIANGGYFVLLPDLFYRAGPYEAPDPTAFARDPELRKRWQSTYTATATKSNVRSDNDSFFAYLAAHEDVRSLSVGTTGYCLGGGLSLATAGNFPERVAAAASYHGGNLATDAPDSPHLVIPRIRAQVYVAGAVEDASFPDEQKQRLIQALEAAKVVHAVETYAGAKHGWVPTDSAAHDAASAERHYRTLFALFETALRGAPPKG